MQTPTATEANKWKGRINFRDSLSLPPSLSLSLSSAERMNNITEENAPDNVETQATQNTPNYSNVDESCDFYDELPDIPCSNEINECYDDLDNMKFVLTNARSIAPKIDSLTDYFSELQLSFSLVTETWLKKEALEKLTQDLHHEHSLKIIAKNRPPTSDEKPVSGGGVSIIFNPSRIVLKEYKLKKSNQEIVAAIGKLHNVKRKVFLICAYIPPKARARSYQAAVKIINDAVMNVKKNMADHYIVIGGDFNRHRFRSITECFTDIENHELGNTCGTADLDKLATNLPSLKSSIRQPLTTNSGSRASDHAVIFIRTLLKNKLKTRKRVIEYVKFTEEGSEEFGNRLLDVDWTKELDDLSLIHI